MIPFVKHCSVILVLVTIGVICNPICYNWCPPTSGYALCCDYYPGDNHYPQPIVLPNYPVTYPGAQVSYLYCPKVDCTKNNNTALKTCTSNDDCLRKETCCNNPCDGQKKCFTTSEQPVQRNYQCPKVSNCTTWSKKNSNPNVCDNIDDCKRSETCCKIPCTGTKVCQNITRSYGGVLGGIQLGINPCSIGIIC